MSLDTRASVAVRNAAIDAITPLFNSGYLRLYSGTRPTNPDTALSGNTLLAELTFGSTAAAGASSGTATFNAITADSSADASGTCTFARCFQSNGTTALIDLEVGTSGANINLNSTSISSGASVSISSFTLSLPTQGA